MRKFYLGVSVLFLSTFLCTSCQREIENLTEDIQQDTCWLSRLISMDTTRPVGLDTAMIANFNYDNNKRLRDYDFTEIGSGGVRYTARYKFFYQNLIDTLPYLMSTTFNYSSDSSATYFSYNNGFIIKDSVNRFVAGSLDRVITKNFSTISNNRYLLKQYETDPSSGFRFLADSTIYYRTISNGNILNTLDSTWDSFSFYRGLEREQINYDQKKGMFRRFQLWYHGHFDNIVNEIWPGGLNNPLSYSYNNTIFVPITESYTISYEYNSDDYPVIARLSGNQDVNKQVFVYRRL